MNEHLATLPGAFADRLSELRQAREPLQLALIQDAYHKGNVGWLNYLQEQGVFQIVPSGTSKALSPGGPTVERWEKRCLSALDFLQPNLMADKSNEGVVFSVSHEHRLGLERLTQHIADEIAAHRQLLSDPWKVERYLPTFCMVAAIALDMPDTVRGIAKAAPSSTERFLPVGSLGQGYERLAQEVPGLMVNPLYCAMEMGRMECLDDLMSAHEVPAVLGKVWTPLGEHDDSVKVVTTLHEIERVCVHAPRDAFAAVLRPVLEDDENDLGPQINELCENALRQPAGHPLVAAMADEGFYDASPVEAIQQALRHGHPSLIERHAHAMPWPALEQLADGSLPMLAATPSGHPETALLFINLAEEDGSLGVVQKVLGLPGRLRAEVATQLTSAHAIPVVARLVELEMLDDRTSVAGRTFETFAEERNQVVASAFRSALARKQVNEHISSQGKKRFLHP